MQAFQLAIQFELQPGIADDHPVISVASGAANDLGLVSATASPSPYAISTMLVTALSPVAR